MPLSYSAIYFAMNIFQWSKLVLQMMTLVGNSTFLGLTILVAFYHTKFSKYQHSYHFCLILSSGSFKLQAKIYLTIFIRLSIFLTIWENGQEIVWSDNQTIFINIYEKIFSSKCFIRNMQKAMDSTKFSWILGQF